MKIVLPKEHGTWVMLFLPYVLGTALTTFKWAHLPFLCGWFFIYLSSTPWLNQLRNKRSRKQMRRWAIAYTGIGLLFAIPVMVLYEDLFWLSLVIIPFFIINILFVLRKRERHLMNDLCAIAILSLGAPAAYVIAANALTWDAMLLWIIVVFYFSGTTFYVKSLIRERKNTIFHKMSHVYHGLMLLVPWLFGSGPLMWVFVPGTLKDWLTPRGKPIRPRFIGISEITNAVVFFILMLVIMPLNF